MKGITGLRLRRISRANAAAPSANISAPLFDAAARDRLIARLKDLADRFAAMSDDEYGDWVNALPRDEFLELIAIGQEVNAQDRAEGAIARNTLGQHHLAKGDQ